MEYCCFVLAKHLDLKKPQTYNVGVAAYYEEE